MMSLLTTPEPWIRRANRRQRWLRYSGVWSCCAVQLCVLFLAVQFVGPSGALAAPPEVVSFNKHVRPILSNNCFYCHGPDDKHREADLRLDTSEGASADLGGYAAVVPGKPDESVLLERVTSHDGDTLMPPPASKKARLSEAEVAILRKWIEQGAKYEGHWAFLPLADVSPPTVKRQDWSRNSVDRFILARLESEGISPSPEADRATLIRRVYLDLIGLLPPPDEVAAFVSDQDPDAYEQIVDRLFSSPHYGERWGRHWLDQARYADSNGYSIDSERQMWPYRDWVIQALNEDVPFDRFTMDQLAGDLLPDPTKKQLVATAFHRNTLINEEGGTDREQFRNESVVDRVNTTGAVWLGLTVGCAQCHTHKFDQITHHEYYSLFAFFNQGEDVNNKGATLSVARGEMFGASLPPPTPPAASTTPDEIAKRQFEWEQQTLAKLEKSVDPKAVQWTPAEYVEYDTTSGAGFQVLQDNSLLSDGRGAFNDTYRVVLRSSLKRVAAVRLRVLTHETLPQQGPGRAGNGNFVLTDVKLKLGTEDQPLAAAHADHEQPNFDASGVLDDNPKSGWAINVAKGSAAKLNANHELVLTLAKAIEPGERQFELQLFHELNENYLIGRFAVDFSETTPSDATVTSPVLLAALKTPAEQRSPEQQKLVQTEFERRDPVAKKAKSDATKKAAAEGRAEVMVMKDLVQSRETFILLRGDFLNPDKAGGPLKPGVVAAVPPLLESREKGSRVDLARWLVDPRNPLTPRVTVNRVWMRYFGRGLVETDEDFGTQGSPPTHPELLDWQAGEFAGQGWSQKRLHRSIVTSSTYRQSSHARPELADKDPRNLLLARQERLRVEAEIVRDAALSASGLLTTHLGGPGVRPPQPDGVYSFTQSAKKWEAETGADRYRRTLYTVFFRSAPHPLFTTFDTPDLQTVCTRRIRSNTPLQALTVANDVVFVELAQGIAGRALRDVSAGDDVARVKRVFELCLCRQPTANELRVLHAYHTQLLQRYTSDSAQATPLLAAKLIASDVPAPQAAALVSVARAIMNTDNFITRE
jgi:mono/diheme cytochrome c family protein